MTADADVRKATPSEAGLTWLITEYPMRDENEHGTIEWTEYAIETPDGTPICSGIHKRSLAEDIAAIPLMKQMLENGIGSRLVPVERSDHAVLVSMAQLLEETLAVQRHILAKLGQASEDRSSVKVETGAKRELKPTVHVYAGDTDGDANTWLVEESLRLHALAQTYCDTENGKQS